MNDYYIGVFLYKANRIEEVSFCPKTTCILKKHISQTKSQNLPDNFKISWNNTFFFLYGIYTSILFVVSLLRPSHFGNFVTSLFCPINVNFLLFLSSINFRCCLCNDSYSYATLIMMPLPHYLKFFHFLIYIGHYSVYSASEKKITYPLPLMKRWLCIVLDNQLLSSCQIESNNSSQFSFWHMGSSQ